MSAGKFNSDRAITRETHQLIRGVGAKLGGRGDRGPDHDDTPGRRSPRRNSYDADHDPRAKPWRPIGDGSVAQGIAFRESLLLTAEEHYHQGWFRYPLARQREARARRAALAAELATNDATPLPVGRPATIRQELAGLEQFLTGAKHRLRRIDITVLRALIRRVDFRTGRLFPAIATIAADAGCHRNSVIGALARLKFHGFLNWVRRTVRTGAAGTFGPQREQTSNAYYFDHRARMAKATWTRFCQLLSAKILRIAPAAAPPPEPPGGRPRFNDPEMREVFERIDAHFSHAST